MMEWSLWRKVSPGQAAAAELASEAPATTTTTDGPSADLRSASAATGHRRGRRETIKILDGSATPVKKRSSPSLASGPRRRVPITPIFPTLSHQATDPSLHSHQSPGRPVNQLRDHPPLIRSGSIYDHVNEEYVHTLRTLFHVCDLDEDGKVTPGELDLMLHLMGLPESEAQQFIARRLPTTDLVDFQGDAITKIGLTFDQVIRECKDCIVTCAAHTQLPSSTFLVRCKPLKLGFNKCDSDGSHFVTKNELEIALQKLEFTLTDAQLEQLVGILDRNGDGKIEWSDFLYAAWANSLAVMNATLGNDFLTIDIFADLPLLLRPASLVAASTNGPAAGQDEAITQRQAFKAASFSNPRASQIDLRLSSRAKSSTNMTTTATADDRTSSAASGATKSRMERMGVNFLMRVSMKRVEQVKRNSAVSPGRSLTRQETMSGRNNSLSGGAPAGIHRRGKRRHGFSPAVRRRMRQIEAVAILLGSLAGVLSGLVSIWFEGMIPDSFEEKHGVHLTFFCVVLINIAVSLLEVNGMYATAVVCAFRLTVCTNLTLYPQDAEREFLTRAIARAALQVGHRKDKIFGIDPMKGSPRLVLFLSYVMYKSKRYMLKFLLKLFIKRVLWRAVAKSVLSLLVLPINGVMNAWTLRNVMLNCRVSIIGPPCAIAVLELFFLDDDGFAPYQRVDYVRVMGCALVCKRSVHPNLEIMLDHMRHRWIRPDKWPTSEHCVCCTIRSSSQEPCDVHLLDDTARFLGSIELYASHSDVAASRSHLRNIVFLLMVALIIDGNLDWAERRLYLRVCTAARLQKRFSDVLKLKDDFVAGKGIHVDAVYALIAVDEAAAGGAPAPGGGGSGGVQLSTRLSARESLQYLWNRVSKLLSW
ncbi:hypothetical protein Gpo141_00011097 [Globisporangium polare]